MCDAGRNSYKYVASPERLSRYEAGPAQKAGGGKRSETRSEVSLAEAVRAVTERGVTVTFRQYREGGGS